MQILATWIEDGYLYVLVERMITGCDPSGICWAIFILSIWKFKLYVGRRA